MGGRWSLLVKFNSGFAAIWATSSAETKNGKNRGAAATPPKKFAAQFFPPTPEGNSTQTDKFICPPPEWWIMSFDPTRPGYLDCAILRALAVSGPTDRATLAAALDAPRTTLYDHLVPLMAANVVARRKRLTPSRRGRPPVEFLLTPEGLKYYHNMKALILKRAESWETVPPEDRDHHFETISLRGADS